MKKILVLIAIVGSGLLVFWLVGISNEESAVIASNSSNAEEKPLNGKALYEENCASCHGTNAQGSEKGPPFLHKVYESSHHSDAAFLMAPKRGVRAHHWKFGDMPPVPSVNDADVVAITAYIRQLQRMVGIK
jgi:mono/diheme cytochrome c family protein